MKRLFFILIAASIMYPATSAAFDLKDIFGNASSAVTNVVEGLLTNSDVQLSQMVGTWTATGSAVSFQSENALKKAGGAAMAGTIEDKLDPYYKKYGLIGSTLTIEKDGNFQLKAKGITLKGTIEKQDNGNFIFSFVPFGNTKIGALKTYVEKTPSGLKVMFDASKLKTILSTVASVTNNSLASTAVNILNSYEGLCVGFQYTK